MTRRTTSRPNTPFLARRRRPPSPLDLPPEGDSAESLDGEDAAERLSHDLFALVDAGLIAPAKQHGDDIRYVPIDPPCPGVAEVTS